MTAIQGFVCSLVVVIIMCCTSASAGTHDRKAFSVPTPSAPACGTVNGVAVQILGSGGPMHGGGRGSAAYLLWYKGRPSVVVDMGGGTATALARAGVGATQVDTVLLSHLHPDHVSDLPEFLWGELVAERKRSLLIVGPSGGNGFPVMRDFLERLFAPGGAFPDMQGILSADEFSLDLHTVSHEDTRASPLVNRDGFRVSTYPVPHGRAPALAYRIDGPGFSVVFGGDQTGLDSGFSQFAMDTDLLILHAMLTPHAVEHGLSHVVALPATLGTRAAEARAKRVVLGHLMSSSARDDNASLWSLSDPDAVLAGVRAHYRGAVSLASDLECIPL